jgi:hypothetical protein
MVLAGTRLCRCVSYILDEIILTFRFLSCEGFTPGQEGQVIPVVSLACP